MTSSRILVTAVLNVVLAAGAAGQAVSPIITGITPPSAAAGSGNLTLTVTGANFQPTSYVTWNGAALSTTYFGPTQLIASVSSALLSAPTIATLNVVNSGGVQSNAVSFSVTSALTITTNSVPPAALGTPYAVSLSASGGVPPYVWSAVGSLPPGLALNSNGSISGTPSTLGTFTFSVRVTDLAQASVSRTFSLTITAPAISITTASPLPAATAGQSYSQVFAATGGTPPYHWSAQSLPAGLSLDAASGTLSGTPATSGTFNLVIQATDSAQAVTSRTFALTVNASPITITTVPPLFTGTLGVPYSQKFSASGGVPPYTWTVLSGSTGGLSLDATSGTLQGTPQSAGTFTFTLQVSDTAGSKASQSFSVTINPPSLTITTGSPLAGGTVGTSYSQTFSVVGGTAPYTWSLTSGSVPGLIFNGSGVLAGTPTTAGTYSLVLQARDANGVTQSKTFGLTISAPPLTLVTTDAQVPGATLGAAYTFTLTASGGTPPYDWSVNGLPAGLSVDTKAGIISGTPTAAGTFSFTVRVSDSTLASVTGLFHLNVALPSAPSVAVSGLPSSAGAAQQLPLSISLGSAFPTDISGQAILSFAPDAGTGDATIQFASGGRTVNFTIPAGTTSAVSAVPVAIQTGTVAGTITVSLRITAGGIDVTPSPAPAATTRVERAAPVITSAVATRTSSGISVQIVGYSTALEVTQATFSFSAAPGQTLQSSTVVVAVSDVFSAWFQNAAAAQFGSQFQFTQPFTIQGSASSVTAQSVTLTNRVGTSSTITISQQ